MRIQHTCNSFTKAVKGGVLLFAPSFVAAFHLILIILSEYQKQSAETEVIKGRQKIKNPCNYVKLTGKLGVPVDGENESKTTSF